MSQTSRARGRKRYYHRKIAQENHEVSEGRSTADLQFIAYHTQCAGRSNREIAKTMLYSCRAFGARIASDNENIIRIGFSSQDPSRVIGQEDIGKAWRAMTNKDHPHHDIFLYWDSYVDDPEKGRPKEYIKGMGTLHPAEFEVKYIVGRRRNRSNQKEGFLEIDWGEVRAFEGRGDVIALQIFGGEDADDSATRESEKTML
ncbi:MAG: hypothetical protein Q9170_002033 [Blastenia crenularia]